MVACGGLWWRIIISIDCGAASSLAYIDCGGASSSSLAQTVVAHHH